MKVKCANGDEGILRQLVGTEVAVNVGGNVFVTKPEEVCGGLVQFRDVARKAVHDAVGEPDTDSSMSVVDDGEYAFENWEEEYIKAHRLMYGNETKASGQGGTTKPYGPSPSVQWERGTPLAVLRAIPCTTSWSAARTAWSGPPGR